MPPDPSPRPHEPAALDAAVARAREAAPEWAAASLPDRLALARELHRGAVRIASRMVAAACEAKGIPLDAPAAGEEWLAGPVALLRILRQTARALMKLSRNGNTPVGPDGETADGRVTVRVFPATRLDAALLPGVRADAHLEDGLEADALPAARARFHHAPDHAGRVVAVLGNGTRTAIGPVDAIGKLFQEGKACVLKLAPAHAWLGPLLEEAFAAAIADGVLAVVQGGADEGAYLAHHAGVDEVHLRGTLRTHDALVWGPPGPERAERAARGRPVLAKPVTSALGNVTPVLVVPGPWDARAVQFHAANVAGMFTAPGAADCTTARVIVTPRGWARREAFLAGIEHHMALVPARPASRADAPAREEAWGRLTAGRAAVRRAGGGEGALPWALVTGLDPGAADEPLFRQEALVPVLAETAVGSDDPEEFLDAAVRFANERLWGTLAVHLLVHPRTIADGRLRAAVERAIRRLRYGVVVLNGWAGHAFVLGTVPWGAWPGAPLANVQSGRGFVHNTLMLDRVEKTVVRFPSAGWPRPLHFAGHRTAHVVGRRLVDLEAGRGWRKLPGVAAAAFAG